MAAKKEAAANEQQVTTQTTPAAEAEDIIANRAKYSEACKDLFGFGNRQVGRID